MKKPRFTDTEWCIIKDMLDNKGISDREGRAYLKAIEKLLELFEPNQELLDAIEQAKQPRGWWSDLGNFLRGFQFHAPH